VIAEIAADDSDLTFHLGVGGLKGSGQSVSHGSGGVLAMHQPQPVKTSGVIVGQVGLLSIPV